MEIPLIALVLGMGYYYNQQKENNETNAKQEPKNIYDSKRSLKIRRDELKHAEDVWNSKNKIYPGPPKIDPKLLFNKVDYEQNKLPVEYNNYNKNDIFTEIKTNKVSNPRYNIYDTNSPISSGWHGISLTGEPINPKDFVHNNMVPFFGGRVKQNVDDKANSTVMEHFTGNIDNYQQKREQGSFFTPETNVCNPYGMANHTDFLQDRIIPSKLMNNVTPVERVRVGPGLNQGYTSQPAGGFQQANTRDYVLPKTVDELRTKNNPKLTYMGRILSGKRISRPGKIGKVEKRKPPSFYVNTPDRYFTTTGAYTAERQRPNVVMKNVNRKITELKRRFGSAKSVYGNKANIRPQYRKSRKIQYRADNPRHFDATGKWCIDNNKYSLHDYGKSRVNMRETERQSTSKNKHSGGPLKAGNNTEARNCQPAKLTRKRYTMINGHTGNMQNTQNAGIAYDPNDIARTTIKEQNIDNSHTGYMQPSEHANVVYDPNDIARTTIKEQNIDNSHTGYMQPSEHANVVYDPNDIARTTIKEQNIDNSHEGFVDGNDYSYVKDPNDKPRKTIKETTIDNNRLGSAQGSQQYKVRDPKDKMRTTTKETTLLENVLGSVYKKLGMGYDVTKNEIRNTIRQFTSNTPYSGVAGSSNKKPQSYEDIYNSTVKSLREQVSRGRVPTLSGAKKFNTQVNMTTKKLGDIQNNHINERGLAPTKVYNSIPQPEVCGITKDKFTVSNENLQDRLDPDILNQLKSNPYSMKNLAQK